jgi:hypothetical protein
VLTGRYITEARLPTRWARQRSVHSPPLSLICNNSKGGSRDEVVLADGNKVLWDDPNPSPKREKEKGSSGNSRSTSLRSDVGLDGHEPWRRQVESYMGNATMNTEAEARSGDRA